MIEKLTQIAPLSSWAVLAGATALLVGAFVAYSHAQLSVRAFGETFGGPASPGTLATMGRWTVALLAGGIALFGVLLGWPTLVVVILGAAAAVALGVEAVVRVLE